MRRAVLVGIDEYEMAALRPVTRTLVRAKLTQLFANARDADHLGKVTAPSLYREVHLTPLGRYFWSLASKRAL
ncbi:hypothetical protein GCM10010174_76700 [Kutzneria viridogrisea]|uniref:Uncharacterized protein n=1 Tax=Kutzneria viridogrisea TaxID=47990 RepID=A0ABR6BNL6_9PSEU|nr:hypothetical protein [Kutzneria viridogrisea]